MAQPYQFAFIDASIDIVWRVVFEEAERHGSIITMQEPNLLVVQSQDICSIYGLRQYPAMENKTGVYLVMTPDEAAAVDLVNAPDLFRALEAMPFDVEPDVYERAKAHLMEIRTLVNEAAKQPVKNAFAPKQAYVQKSSIDPHKSSIGGATGYEGMPVVSLRLVWVVFIFCALSILLNGVFPAASLLALNWWSMDRPRKALSTLLTSIAVWGLFAIPIQMVFGSLAISPGSFFSVAMILQLFVGAGVIFWQTKQQAPAYHEAVARYGKPSGWTCRNILISVAVIIAGCTMANTWVRIFTPILPGTTATLSSPQTYRDDRVTFNYPNHWIPMSAAEEVCAAADDPEQPGRLTCSGFGWEKDASSILFTRTKNYFGFFTTLDGMSQKDIETIETNPESVIDTEHTTQVKFKIDGRDAIKYRYQYTRKSSRFAVVGTVLYIRDDYDWVRLYIYTPPGRVDTADAIIDSLQFLTPLDD